jgi:hypothetical protein
MWCLFRYFFVLLYDFDQFFIGLGFFRLWAVGFSKEPIGYIHKMLPFCKNKQIASVLPVSGRSFRVVVSI